MTPEARAEYDQKMRGCQGRGPAADPRQAHHRNPHIHERPDFEALCVRADERACLVLIEASDSLIGRQNENGCRRVLQRIKVVCAGSTIASRVIVTGKIDLAARQLLEEIG